MARRGVKLAIGAVLVCAALGVVSSLLGVEEKRPAPPAPPKPHASDLGAWSACRRFVLARIATPKTAEFQDWLHARYEKPSGGTYVVRSYVDAQNLFGATVRTRFVCMVIWDPGTASYSLESLTPL